MKEKLAVIGALIVIIGTCFGVYFFAENRYALSQEVKKDIQEIKQTQEKESKRLDYKILSDQLRSVQDRIWKIKDRYENKPPKDPTVKEELRELEGSKIAIGDRLKEMEVK
jgi:hypothetical protein